MTLLYIISFVRTVCCIAVSELHCVLISKMNRNTFKETPFDTHTIFEYLLIIVQLVWIDAGHCYRDVFGKHFKVNKNMCRQGIYTGLFISPSGISELDCAATKTDTAERSISIGRESLQVSVLSYRCSICAPCDTRCNACRRILITGLTSAASPRVQISSTCKVGQKLGEILYLLICSFLPCLSWLLRSRVRKSRRDL